MANKNKYYLRRVSHFVKGLGYSLWYSYINTKRNKTIIFNSSLNESFTWNAKSLFLNAGNRFRQLGYEVFFVIDDEVKRKALTEKYGNVFISSLTPVGRKKIYTAGVWVLSALEMPCSGIFLKRKRLVYHLGHGTPIKNIGLKEKKVSFSKYIFYKLNATNITFFLSTSKYFVPYMSKAFGVGEARIVIAPQPRIDDYINNKESFIDKIDGYRYILYAPTWRPYAHTRLFPFEKFDVESFSAKLKSLKVILLIRLHPRYEKEGDRYLTDNIKLFDSNICPDISDALWQTDALITDYSSIYCDYLLLNKPVAFIPYDKEIYEREIGFSHDYNEMTTNEHIYTENDFFDFIHKIDSASILEKQKKLCNLLNFMPKNESITEFNVKFINEEYQKL